MNRSQHVLSLLKEQYLQAAAYFISTYLIYWKLSLSVKLTLLMLFTLKEGFLALFVNHREPAKYLPGPALWACDLCSYLHGAPHSERY